MTKRFVLTALLSTLPLQSFAWVQVLHRGGSDMHMDEKTVSKQGEYWSVTTISNFDEPSKRQINGYRHLKSSIKHLVLLDCRTKSYQTVDSIWFDGKWAEGQGHRIGRPTAQWRGPDSMHYSSSMYLALFPLVCKNK